MIARKGKESTSVASIFFSWRNLDRIVSNLMCCDRCVVAGFWKGEEDI